MMRWEEQGIIVYYGTFVNHAISTREQITALTCRTSIQRAGKSFWPITDKSSEFFSFQAPEGSYANSGWDEAHCAAFMNQQGSEETAHAVMCGLNRAPQKPSLNRKLFGHKLEPYIKKKVYDVEVKDGDEINVAKYELAHVYTGVALSKKKSSNTSSTSTMGWFGLPGKRQVAVPDLWWKAVLAKPFDKAEYELESWVFKNTTNYEYTGKEELWKYYEPINVIYELAGEKFLPPNITIAEGKENWNFTI